MPSDYHSRKRKMGFHKLNFFGRLTALFSFGLAHLRTSSQRAWRIHRSIRVSEKTLGNALGEGSQSMGGCLLALACVFGGGYFRCCLSSA